MSCSLGICTVFAFRSCGVLDIGALSFVVSEIQGLSEASMRQAWGTGQYGNFRKLGYLTLRSFL